MSRVLVTGASGFVGRALCEHLLDHGVEVTATARSERSAGLLPAACRVERVPDLVSFDDWSRVLSPAMSVVHLVARTHCTRETAADARRAYQRVNVLGTQRLLAACERIGVRRFVYLSSIKAVGEGDRFGEKSGYGGNGGSTPLDSLAYDEASRCAPRDAYGQTKQSAEQLVRNRCSAAGIAWVILRPPLVYGPGAQGNLRRVMRWLQRGWPVPLPTRENARSLIDVRSLVRALDQCLHHPAAADQVFHVADARPLSTSEIVSHLADGMGRPLRGARIPTRLLEAMGRVTGRAEEVRRWTGSLTVATQKAERYLDWTAEANTAAGLRRMSAAFQSNSSLRKRDLEQPSRETSEVATWNVGRTS